MRIQDLINQLGGQDAYDVLGVDPTANATAIKRAYHKKSLIYHPDKQSADETEFKRLGTAYEILNSEDLRKQYDEIIAKQPRKSVASKWSSTMRNSQEEFDQFRRKFLKSPELFLDKLNEGTLSKDEFRFLTNEYLSPKDGTMLNVIDTTEIAQMLLKQPKWLASASEGMSRIALTLTGVTLKVVDESDYEFTKPWIKILDNFCLNHQNLKPAEQDTVTHLYQTISSQDAENGVPRAVAAFMSHSHKSGIFQKNTLAALKKDFAEYINKMPTEKLDSDGPQRSV